MVKQLHSDCMELYRIKTTLGVDQERLFSKKKNFGNISHARSELPSPDSSALLSMHQTLASNEQE
jgi:hypothetical protein